MPSVGAHPIAIAAAVLIAAGAAVAAFFISRYSNVAHCERQTPRRRRQSGFEYISTDPTCSICREDINVTQEKYLKCGHVFHKACIEEWTNRSPTCPNCMTGI